MIRKSLHILLILALTVTTTGFSISKHFCGDRLVSVSLNDETEPCCGENSGCCDNETSFFQLDDDFLYPTITDLNQTNQDQDHLKLFLVTGLIAADDNRLSKIVESDKSPPTSISTNLSLIQSYLL